MALFQRIKNVAEHYVIVLSICGLPSGCSFRQLKPKIGTCTLQKQLTVKNTLNSDLLTNFLLLLISQLKHLDNHKTYYFVTHVTSVMGSGFI